METLHPTHDVAALQRKLLTDCLRQTLGDVDGQALDELAQRCEWVEVHGGSLLFREGDADDSLYVVISGRLRAVRTDDDGERLVLGDIVRGESVGELALFTREPRSASVFAVRDTLLARFTSAVFQSFLLAHPRITIGLTRLVIQRSKGSAGKKSAEAAASLALVAATPGVDLQDAAQRFTRALQPGQVQLVTSAMVDAWLGEAGAAQAAPGDTARTARLAHLLERVEVENQFVVLVGDPQPTQWTLRCMRQSDRVLLLADVTADPQPSAMERDSLYANGHASNADAVLVLLHPDDAQAPSGTRHWLAPRPQASHLHVRRGRDADWQRLARVVTGRATGLVLSGGGARGFAHLGVLKALEEQGHQWDMVGGTSIGAVMAAFAAMDIPVGEAIARARAAFRQNPTGDYNLLPVISLISGQRLRRIIDESVTSAMGEDSGIEDLWKPYFCVASNYTAARESVLTRGPLAKSIRASVAIPGALPPVALDGDLHIDGGTFNNFPTDVMAARGASRIIGVNLLRERGRKYARDEVPSGWRLALDKLRGRRLHLPGIVPLLLNSSIMYSYARQMDSKRLVDLYFAPPVHGYGMLDWSKFDRIVQAGYEHAVERLQQPAGTEAASDQPARERQAA